MATLDSFEDIMGATFTAVEAQRLGQLMVEADAKIEASFDAAREMQEVHPYIMPGTALYRVGLALEQAYQTRGELIDESIDVNSQAYEQAETEHDMTIKRRAVFGQMCSEISLEAKFNRDPEVRLIIFENAVDSMKQKLMNDIRLEEVSFRDGSELIELAEHIGQLCQMGVSLHFQTA